LPFVKLSKQNPNDWTNGQNPPKPKQQLDYGNDDYAAVVKNPDPGEFPIKDANGFPSEVSDEPPPRPPRTQQEIKDFRNEQDSKPAPGRPPRPAVQTQSI
jgi:hypothetical protein